MQRPLTNWSASFFQWDEGIQKMSLGETAELRIEAEWAYGRKGLEGKYPFATVYVAGCGYCFFLLLFHLKI